MSYENLRIYWWILISLFGGLLVFLMFVQGGQTLLGACKSDTQKDLIINSLGRKWELTFTTLVVFGGASFAAFPLFYSTSFGGAYWVWLIILFCFIIQAVSFEYRKKPDNFLGQKTYEKFLFINGSLGVILIGMAVSTFFSGAHFALSDNNFVIYKSSLRGLEALFNPFNYILGFAIFFLARVGGCLYLINNINDDELDGILRVQLIKNSIKFVPLFVLFLICIFLRSGFAYDNSGLVYMQKFKYFMNFIQMPIVGLMLLFGTIFVLVGIYQGITNSKKGIFLFGFGVVLAVMSIFLCVGLNNTCFYPSNYDIQNSLNIINASSSFYTLKTMSWVSLIAPFVLAYIAYTWSLMDKSKISKFDVENKNKKDVNLY